MIHKKIIPVLKTSQKTPEIIQRLKIALKIIAIVPKSSTIYENNKQLFQKLENLDKASHLFTENNQGIISFPKGCPRNTVLHVNSLTSSFSTFSSIKFSSIKDRHSKNLIRIHIDDWNTLSPEIQKIKPLKQEAKCSVM